MRDLQQRPWHDGSLVQEKLGTILEAEQHISSSRRPNLDKTRPRGVTSHNNRAAVPQNMGNSILVLCYRVLHNLGVLHANIYRNRM
jgi:hypothetical protein